MKALAKDKKKNKDKKLNEEEIIVEVVFADETTEIIATEIPEIKEKLIPIDKKKAVNSKEK